MGIRKIYVYIYIKILFHDVCKCELFYDLVRLINNQYKLYIEVLIIILIKN